MDPVDKLEEKKIEELEKEEETTICSTMHCYNRAKETHDPRNPPFCEQCQDRKKRTKG